VESLNLNVRFAGHENAKNLIKNKEAVKAGKVPCGCIIQWSNFDNVENLCMVTYGDRTHRKLVSLSFPGCTYTVHKESEVWLVAIPKGVTFDLHK
jgi:hypothetical protein